MKRTFAFALSLGLIACAQKAAPFKVSDADRYLYQRDAARMTVLQSQAQPLLDEQTKLKADACKAAAIDVASCKVDWETGVVTAAPAPMPPPAPKAK